MKIAVDVSPTVPHKNALMLARDGFRNTMSERRISREGVASPRGESVETQLRRCYAQFQQCVTPLQKHIYLKALNARSHTLFCRLASAHLIEMLPILYTPTVGQACLSYSLHYREPEGLHVTAEHRGKISSVLDNWRLLERGGSNSRSNSPTSKEDVAIIVVTDGSRILGLGDLGFNGMGIPVGKLFLYVLAGGFKSTVTLPVIIDYGTDNKALLEDEFYLGLRTRRLDDNTFYSLMDEFMEAVQRKWPNALVQFEDFSNSHCFDLLERFKNKQLCFNDDIQGTGVVISSGVLNALRLNPSLEIKKMRFLFVGAGSAAVGVAEQIARSLEARYKLPIAECRRLFYMVDSKGLVTTNRSDADKLASFKKPYARNDVDSRSLPTPSDLLSIIKLIQPHALIGLSGMGGVFSTPILKEMARQDSRPIVFALSNPTDHAECTFKEAFEATEGRVVFASGSPFEPIVAQPGGKLHAASQGNNLYAFPGIGFGAWLCRAKRITDEMLTAASIALADMVSSDELSSTGSLYPPLTEIRGVAARVAAAVIQTAYKEGVAASPTPDPLDTEKLIKFVEEQQYNPEES